MDGEGRRGGGGERVSLFSLSAVLKTPPPPPPPYNASAAWMTPPPPPSHSDSRSDHLYRRPVMRCARMH